MHRTANLKAVEEIQRHIQGLLAHHHPVEVGESWSHAPAFCLRKRLATPGMTSEQEQAIHTDSAGSGLLTRQAASQATEHDDGGDGDAAKAGAAASKSAGADVRNHNGKRKSCQDRTTQSRQTRGMQAQHDHKSLMGKMQVGGEDQVSEGGTQHGMSACDMQQPSADDCDMFQQQQVAEKATQHDSCDRGAQEGPQPVLKLAESPAFINVRSRQLRSNSQQQQKSAHLQDKQHIASSSEPVEQKCSSHCRLTRSGRAQRQAQHTKQGSVDSGKEVKISNQGETLQDHVQLKADSGVSSLLNQQPTKHTAQRRARGKPEDLSTHSADKTTAQKSSKQHSGCTATSSNSSSSSNGSSGDASDDEWSGEDAQPPQSKRRRLPDSPQRQQRQQQQQAGRQMPLPEPAAHPVIDPSELGVLLRPLGQGSSIWHPVHPRHPAAVAGVNSNHNHVYNQSNMVATSSVDAVQVPGSSMTADQPAHTSQPHAQSSPDHGVPQAAAVVPLYQGPLADNVGTSLLVYPAHRLFRLWLPFPGHRAYAHMVVVVLSLAYEHMYVSLSLTC